MATSLDRHNTTPTAPQRNECPSIKLCMTCGHQRCLFEYSLKHFGNMKGGIILLIPKYTPNIENAFNTIKNSKSVFSDSGCVKIFSAQNQLICIFRKSTKPTMTGLKSSTDICQGFTIDWINIVNESNHYKKSHVGLLKKLKRATRKTEIRPLYTTL